MARRNIFRNNSSAISLVTPNEDLYPSCLYDGRNIETPPFVEIETTCSDHRASAYINVSNVEPLAAALRDDSGITAPSESITYEFPETIPPCFLCEGRIQSIGIRMQSTLGMQPLWLCSECPDDLANHLDRVWDEAGNILADSL